MIVADKLLAHATLLSDGIERPVIYSSRCQHDRPGTSDREYNFTPADWLRKKEIGWYSSSNDVQRTFNFKGDMKVTWQRKKLYFKTETFFSHVFYRLFYKFMVSSDRPFITKVKTRWCSEQKLQIIQHKNCFPW